MADLLLQSSIKDIETAFTSFAATGGGGKDYSIALGQSLNAQMKAAIEASSTSGPYTTAGGGGTSLYKLTCWCETSACVSGGIGECGPPLFGSTTQLTAYQYANNIWCTTEVLSPAVSPSQSSITTDLLALSSMSTVSDLNGLDNTVSDDVYLEYLKLRSTFTTENNTDVLLNWYGVGAAGTGPGQPLSTTNRIKVCDANWKQGQGPATCSWTVPAGATRAKFQVWGAGQGTNGGGCCCGGNPFGETGAYAELVVDVTPGESYTACAGCSCYGRVCCCSNSTPAEGCGSGVTGPAICCLFASGARCYTSNCNDLNFLRCQTGFAGGACHKFMSPYCQQSGPCWCSYSEYCYDNSCATCGVVPVYPACCFSCSCSCGGLSRNSTDGQASTHKGMHGGGCLDTNNYGYHTRPPVIDSDTGGIYTGGCWCASFTSGSCPSRCFYQWDDHPGHGGPHGHVMGGTNSAAGTPGRSGLVQISWE